MNPPEKRPSLAEIILAFTTVGLTSVGGAAGPLRHMIVKKKQWLSETEFAETVGLGQALPGAVVVNVGVMLMDRMAGPLGVLAALAGLIVPAMLVAIALLGIATRISEANPRFAAAEVGVTAALAGIFLSNGTRVLMGLWHDDAGLKAAWRSARVAIGALGVVLVAGFHMFLPIAMIVLIALSLLFEMRLGTATVES